MRRPKRLVLGDTVALVNPAGMLPDRFARQLDYVKEYLGQMFKVKDHILYDNWADPKRRTEALHRAFADQEVKAIFPLCGSDLIYEILPELDYGLISQDPKILVGSSSLSALIMSIEEFAGLVTFYGPHMNFLNPKASWRENNFTINSFWNMFLWDWHGKNSLNKNEAFHFFRAPKDEGGGIVVRNIYREPHRIKNANWRDNFYLTLTDKESVSGVLTIGTLDALIPLCRYRPIVTSGKIFFLDALGKSLDETFASFQELGTLIDLTKCSTIVFSSITERGDQEKTMPELHDQFRVQEFLKDVSRQLGGAVPLLFGFPVGHCAYKLTLPAGIPATIKVASGEIVLHEIPHQE